MVTQWSVKVNDDYGEQVYTRTTRNALSNAAEKILDVNPKRVKALLRNFSVTAAEVIYVGDDDTVGPTNGVPLDAGTAADVHGESVEWDGRGEVWAEAATGTPAIVIEEVLRR